MMFKRSLYAVVLLLATQTASFAGPLRHVPMPATLRRSSVHLFVPASDSHPRALILFFGNDIGFWKPHVDLAERLAGRGYVVVGLDIREYLSHLAADESRERVFSDSISALIDAARREFGESVPFILAGHSFGAEVALWVAQHREPPGLRGVLAMSPRGSGHLFVSPLDLTHWEPRGPDAWSTIEATRRIDPRVRIALIRGAHDYYAFHDSAFVAAGGGRLHRYVIPFASHSLKRLLLAGPIIEYAVAELLRS